MNSKRMLVPFGLLSFIFLIAFSFTSQGGSWLVYDDHLVLDSVRICEHRKMRFYFAEDSIDRIIVNSIHVDTTNKIWEGRKYWSIQFDVYCSHLDSQGVETEGVFDFIRCSNDTVFVLQPVYKKDQSGKVKGKIPTGSYTEQPWLILNGQSLAVQKRDLICLGGEYNIILKNVTYDPSLLDSIYGYDFKKIHAKSHDFVFLNLKLGRKCGILSYEYYDGNRKITCKRFFD